MMRYLLKNIRRIIYLVNFAAALIIFIYALMSTTSERLFTIRLSQSYALYAVFLLYCALIASPLYTVFPNLSFRTLHITARKAIGNSAFFFALLHAAISFFFSLGGFAGLAYLGSTYLIAITLSFTALVILLLMFVTSFGYFITRLGRRWKPVHRLVYVASIFILIHALMLGTHFTDLSGLIPQISIYALAVLLMLESYRFDAYLASKIPVPRYILAVVLISITAFVSYHALFNTQLQNVSIHAKHLAGKAARKNRFTVDLQTAPQYPLNKSVLSFKIYDEDEKKTLDDFAINYEKIMHMIVVDSSLTYFSHEHPNREGDTFNIETSFPKEGTYQIYLNYHPIGYQEQVSSFVLPVGKASGPQSNQRPDANLTKTFGNYQVTLSSTGELKAESLNAGTEILIFSIADHRTGKPVTNLSPYLGAFGHMIMINQKTYDYIHVHPSDLGLPVSGQKGGPDVRFTPLSITTKIVPGIYRIFGQFMHSEKLFLADYTVEIQ